MQKHVLLAALALMGVLVGCGRSGNQGKSTTTAAEARPADTVTAKTSKAPESPPAPLLIQVFQEDSDSGVAAVVSRLDDTGATHFVADIDNTGIAKLPQPCAASDRFEASPKVAAFLRVAPQPCAPTVTFRLYSAQAAYELIRVAENDEKTGNLPAAQAKYGLAAERLQFSKPQEADKLKVLASKSVGKLLGVDQPTTVVDGKTTIAPLMVDRLKQYQRRANIPETGVIDRKTREALSREKATSVVH